jgi:hypothetical protein
MKLEPFSLSAAEEQALMENQLQEMLKLFEHQLYSGERPEVCRITYEVFENAYDSPHHNCIGCNLLESTDLLYQYLQINQGPYHKLYPTYATYFMLLYLLVERLDTILNLVELPKSYREKHFKVLLRIRRWANFLKHPKAFLLVHHPVYTCVGAGNIQELSKNANVTVDENFVARYYSNDDRNETLYKTLENKDDVLVIFPDAVHLTSEFCAAIKEFIDLLRDNAVYKEILDERSTFLDYWIDIPQEVD